MPSINHLPNHSRVWIYQSSREFNAAESEQIQGLLDKFVGNWSAHKVGLYAGGELRYQRFIILAVDESQVGASGCSIDSSVHFLKKLEQEFQVSLFDRMLFAYKDGKTIKVLKREEFEASIERGEIKSETLVFNNMVSTIKELDSGWEVPLENSWHSKFFAASAQKTGTI